MADAQATVAAARDLVSRGALAVAAAYASVAVIEGRWSEAAQSVLQLGVNLVGAIGAAAAVLVLARRGSRRRGADRALSDG